MSVNGNGARMIVAAFVLLGVTACGNSNSTPTPNIKNGTSIVVRAPARWVVESKGEYKGKDRYRVTSVNQFGERDEDPVGKFAYDRTKKGQPCPYSATND